MRLRPVGSEKSRARSRAEETWPHSWFWLRGWWSTRSYFEQSGGHKLNFYTLCVIQVADE